MGGVSSAQAQDCSDYPGGVLDGSAGTIAPAQLQIDRNCTIRNFPASNPLSTNFSFLTQPGQTNERWLIVFDNVVHTGQMACNSVAGHRIWFTNGSSTSIQEGCQNLLIPVEKIDKRNPAGQTTAAIGVPFTYSLTIPVLFDPATGSVINASGSLNDLHGVIVTDDLNATGVDLTYLSHVAYWQGSGTPVPHTFSNVDGLLTFDGFPIIPAGQQIEIEITVVLADTPANVAGTQFVNTAKWEFGRLIDGVFYQPLPGEWGITPPLTIGAPQLVVTKTGPATLGLTLNLGEWGQFGLDVHNTGLSDAWNVTILDRLPDGPTGGMCDTTPEVLSARVFEADGSTPVSGVLVEGSDFSLGYGPAPSCELTLTLLTAAGTIGANQRLIITYRTKLDADSQNGVTLTNVAGATQWFNADGSNPNRQAYTRTLSDGSVGVPDHEDAHTVTVALSGYFFEKSVENLTSGVSPTATAAPGDTLRYTLRLQSTDVPLNDLTFHDDLGALNAFAAFVPGSLALVAGSIPPGADASNTDPSGGTNGSGILDIRGLSVASSSEVRVQFDIRLDATLADGSVILNQADLLSTIKLADSDDPNINGQADPNVAGDEDPTQVVIARPPLAPLLKQNTQATASVGETFRYRITIPQAPYAFPVYDVRITDDLSVSAADLRFVGVTKISGSEPWTPVNTGPATDLVIEDPAFGIDIPAGEQVVVEISVVLEDTPTNVAGLPFINTASFVYHAIDGDPASQLAGSPGTTPPMTIVEPELTLEKGGPAQMTPATPGTFRLDVHNTGSGPAWNLTITDQLPDGPTGGTCDVAPSAITAQLFAADGVTPVSGPLVEGTDFAVSFAGPPACVLGLTFLSAVGTIGPDQRLVVSYATELDADSQNGAALTNVAGATEWFSFDASSLDRRRDTRTLTDGSVEVLDHEDAHTVDVFVDAPVLFAAKDVAILVDAGTPNVVDPGDVLRYTIRVENSGGVVATAVSLTDGVPANTTYVADSTTLNGLPVNQPDGGASPLAAGLPISSGDLTPPLPGPGEGTLSPGETALVEFDLRVNAGVPGGTVISNQAVVGSTELPALLSDGDGDPTTGPEPTVVVVGDGQQLLITKAVQVVGGGAALAGSTLEYTVSVLNIAFVPAYNVVITDDLDAPTPGQLGYVDPSATLNGAATGLTIAGSLITADYAGAYGPLQPGASAVLRFQAVLDAGLAPGTTVTNTGVVTWNTPPQTASASVSIDVGGMPGVGALNGTVWHDADFDDGLDSGERLLEGWSVELLRNGQPLQSVLTAADGTYAVVGVAPNDVSGDSVELRFRAPGAGPNSAALGRAASVFTNGLHRISDIVVASGSNLQGLDLPIDPNGVVYDALGRTAVPGATLTLLNASVPLALPSSCFDDPAQQGQVTGSDGYYKFDLNFSDAACPSGGSYLIALAPGAGFVAGYSQIIPPLSDASTPPFSVPACPGSVADAVPGTPQHCEVQASEFAPPGSVAPGSAGTSYYVHLSLDASQAPGSSQIFNNHIALDPVLDGAVAITKTTPSLRVSRGELVPYEVTVTNQLGSAIPDLGIVDRFPAGFRYVPGSARVDGVAFEPSVDAQELTWNGLGIAAASSRKLVLLLAVGAGVSEGKYVNRAQAISGLAGGAVSGMASATVGVAPDPTFACTDVMGKVFDDANRNGLQDAGELGLQGIRLVTPRGLIATTDPHGRYHITCATTPNEARGSNFVLKLDDRTLPSGYRMSTRKLQVARASRGKALRMNYAASIHRVVSLDLADAVFEPGSREMRPQWRPRIDRLLEELQKEPATLRLSYIADLEDSKLVERRLDAVERQIMDAWQALDGGYELTVEPEVFWRRGAPLDEASARTRKGG
jgi:uncharacterized repeat protein (TIGR01451 family)